MRTRGPVLSACPTPDAVAERATAVGRLTLAAPHTLVTQKPSIGLLMGMACNLLGLCHSGIYVSVRQLVGLTLIGDGCRRVSVHWRPAPLTTYG